MDLDSVSFHKLAKKKELNQYPATLTSCLGNVHVAKITKWQKLKIFKVIGTFCTHTQVFKFSTMETKIGYGTFHVMHVNSWLFWIVLITAYCQMQTNSFSLQHWLNPLKKIKKQVRSKEIYLMKFFFKTENFVLGEGSYKLRSSSSSIRTKLGIMKVNCSKRWSLFIAQVCCKMRMYLNNFLMACVNNIHLTFFRNMPSLR